MRAAERSACHMWAFAAPVAIDVNYPDAKRSKSANPTATERASGPSVTYSQTACQANSLRVAHTRHLLQMGEKFVDAGAMIEGEFQRIQLG